MLVKTITKILSWNNPLIYDNLANAQKIHILKK
jgi:hypothetical protein